MIMRLDVNDFIHAFKDYNREDNFSREGLRELFEYYEQDDENMELDVIAICCDWTEYDEDEILEQYGDNVGYAHNIDYDYNKHLEEVLEYLRDRTSVLPSKTGFYLVANF